MKRTSTQLLGLLAFLGLGMTAYGQYNGKVGINQDKPNATLEIQISEANKNSDTKEGILIPNVTAARAEAMGSDVEESTLVYITDGTTGTGTISEVKGKGFYYFDKATQKWTKVGGGTSTATPQTWEQIRYGANGKHVISANHELIPANAWFVLIPDDATIKTIKLPTLTPADAGRMMVVYKQGFGNVTVLDEEEKTYSQDPTAKLRGNSGIISNRGRTFIWDGDFWQTTNY